MLEYQQGTIKTSKKIEIGKSKDQIYYYNVSNVNGGKAKILSEVFENKQTPERIFVSNLEVNKTEALYVVKMSYLFYKLANAETNKFYNMKHGVIEFNAKRNTKYEIPIPGLKEQKFSIYLTSNNSQPIKFASLFEEYLTDFGNISDSCKNNIHMEFLRTDNQLTEIKIINNFFPVIKAKEFYNKLTKINKVLNNEIFYSEINFPFKIYGKNEIAKIPNYDKIKKGFTASIKVFAVPVCNKENKPTFDIYIVYSRFKDSFYCEWNTIKKRVILNSSNKIKLELPGKDWRMRAFNQNTLLT